MFTLKNGQLKCVIMFILYTIDGVFPKPYRIPNRGCGNI